MAVEMGIWERVDREELLDVEVFWSLIESSRSTQDIKGIDGGRPASSGMNDIRKRLYA